MIRPSYFFDDASRGPVPQYGRDWRYVHRLAVGQTADGIDVAYCELGRHGGIAFLLGHHDGRWGLSYGWLHADALSELPEPQPWRNLLSQVADMLTSSGSVVERLMRAEEVPGFTRPSGLHPNDRRWPVHESGWFTRSRFALRLPVPSWACGAEVYDLREGIYLRFQDGSSRLIRRRDYYIFSSLIDPQSPTARQGDLLVFRYAPHIIGLSDAVLDRAARWQAVKVDGPARVWPILESRADLDRHTVLRDGDEIIIEHPEHEMLRVPVTHAHWLVVTPGASPPFRVAGD